MSLANTDQSYGLAARILHWLTALLIFAAFPLGFLANRAELIDEAAIARAYSLFSAHKTVGILAFLIILARILWSLFQRRPAPMPHARWERTLAQLVHWTLAVALVAVPVSGWLAHAAEPGLAPILVPFPETLGPVAERPGLAAAAGNVHFVATKVLAVAVLLHIVGALKHALIDRDATLARMTRGAAGGDAGLRHPALPAVAALALWAAAIGLGIGLAPAPSGPPQVWPASTAEVALVRAGDGTVIGVIPAADVTLALADDGSGTLDIFAAVDSLDAPEAAPLLADLVLPVLTYSGALTGTPPDLTATGTLDLGGVAESQEFSVTLDGNTARLTEEAPLPGAPDFLLRISAAFDRPAQ